MCGGWGSVAGGGGVWRCVVMVGGVGGWCWWVLVMGCGGHVGVCGIKDSRQFAFCWTNKAGLEAQLLDRTQPNVNLLQTTKQSSTKVTGIRQYY